MTPFGYLMALGIECLVATSMVFMGAPPFCLLIGACTLLTEFSKDIANDLVNFNTDAVLNHQNEMKKFFCNILQEYADVKQLSAQCIFYGILELCSFIHLD